MASKVKKAVVTLTKKELYEMAVKSGANPETVKSLLYPGSANREKLQAEYESLKKKLTPKWNKLNGVSLSQKDRKGNVTKVQKWSLNKKKVIVWHPGKSPEAKVTTEEGVGYVQVSVEDAQSILEGKSEAFFTVRKAKKS